MFTNDSHCRVGAFGTGISRFEFRFRLWIGKHAQDKAELQKVLWQSQELRKQSTEADAYAAKLHQDRQVAAAQQNPFTAKQQEVQNQIDGVRVQLLECEGRINGLTERMKVLNFWVEAFGPKGLKSYILDTRLQEMTDAANQWVKLLTGGTCWVRFETQTMGRGGKLSNKLNIRVFQYQRSGQIIERNYKSLSGGQKARISMGVDFGLSRLVAARARQRYDLLVLDEVFKHLDRAGREAVVEMLHELRKEKSSVIVIDHDAEFGASFENVLWVDYQNHRSTIREVRGVHTAQESQGTLLNHGTPVGAAVPGGSAQTAVG
jgi:DNA repair exonuclease SbcCD ATPase subunit